MRARPSPRDLEAQRQAEGRWRRQVASLPFAEKIRMVMELQQRLYPVLRQRRPMRAWERPWPVAGTREPGD